MSIHTDRAYNLAKRPEPYVTDYRCDRRKHRHRCLSCNRILQPGDRVLGWRIADRVTRFIHVGHMGEIAFRSDPRDDDPGLASGEWTWRQIAWGQSSRYAHRLGHRVDNRTPDRFNGEGE